MNVIASRIGLPTRTVADVCEPVLIRFTSGYFDRLNASRSRSATDQMKVTFSPKLCIEPISCLWTTG